LKLVNRFKDAWRLDDAVLAQINGIFDDPVRLPGEGIALLPWSAFEASLGPAETAARHHIRLEGWRDALDECCQSLPGEIEGLELRLANWQGVHDLWQSRCDGGAGQNAWNAYLDQRRRELDEAIGKTQDEIDRLHIELAGAGGGP
jgi:hypothetical protein